jgi:RNA polymerase subunit RPABC4/transcription elongation factor Spt4
MTCYKCGLELAPFEIICPRCAKQKTTPTGTNFLPDLSDSRTQHLVQLEQCRHCRMLLFPGDDFCPSCGAAVSRPQKNAPPPKKKPSQKKAPALQKFQRQDTRRWVAVGFAVSAAVVVLVAFIYVLRHI